MKQLTLLESVSIPDKIYFRIGEVSGLVGVDTHVLRYWETEFKIIKPHRGKSKQRLYRKQDVKNLLLIKYLLHDEGYTISGARKLLKTKKKGSLVVPPGLDSQGTHPESRQQLTLVKNELIEILGQLQSTK